MKLDIESSLRFPRYQLGIANNIDDDQGYLFNSL